jgi:hypothetical protein
MSNRDRKDLEHDSDRIDLESPLGLADEPIVRNPSDHLVDDETSARRRRTRALGEDTAEGTRNRDDHGGASSIDMGYGGEGTDVKSSR